MTATSYPPMVLTHGYTPRGTQLQMMKSRASEVVLSGPAGTGKSRACLEKVHTMCLAFPDTRALFIRKTRESLTSTGLVSFQRDVIPEARANGTTWYYGGSTQDPAAYRYLNGSTILIGGMKDEMQAGKVMSSEYDIIYVQEATDLDETDWEKLTTRLRSNRTPYQQIIADCNPQHPTHWLKVRSERGQTLMLDTTHEENPLYFSDDGKVTDQGRDYIAKLDALTGVTYLRLRKGLWAAAEGIIYADFDPAVHVVDPFEIPDDWAMWWTVDFGTRHPFVFQMWAENNDGVLFLVKEIFYTERRVDEHAQTIKRITQGFHTPQKFICDHQLQERLILEKELGIPTTAANKDVATGIQSMQKRYKERRIFYFRDALFEQDPKLAESKRPTSTVAEIPGYVWLNSKTPKEGPVKDADDGQDASRYLVAELDLRGQMSFRTLGRRS